MSIEQKRKFAQGYLTEIATVINLVNVNDLVKALVLLEKAFNYGKQVFIAGNGGSAATASHMANDLLMGVSKIKGKGFRALALTDNKALITAIANDISYEEIFSAQLKELGHPGDLLLVFSGSGNSPNILRLVKLARKMKIKTIAFLGKQGGLVKSLADCPIIVKSDAYGPIEDVHMLFNHLIASYFMKR